VVQPGWTQTCPGQTVANRLFEVRVSGTTATISEVQPGTGSILRSFPAPAAVTFAGPQGLALGPNSLFYIDGSGSGPHTLWELNPDTGAVIRSDVVDAASPTEIAGLGYLNGKVYLQLDQQGKILVWDPVAHAAVTTFTVAADLTGGLTGAGDLGVLFDSNNVGQVFEIDPATGAILATFSPGVGSLDGGLAYVNDELIASNFSDPATAYCINPSTGAVLGSFVLGGTGPVSGLGGDGAVSLAGSQTVTLAAGQVVTGTNFGNEQQATVTSVGPTSGPAAGGTPVTITGTNLANATAVDFGSTAGTITSDTATQIVATSPAGTAGTVDVTVVTAAGTSTKSAADQFTYVTYTVQTITDAAGNIEYQMWENGFQFGTLLQTPQGAVGFRGHPDQSDINGWGTTVQENVYIAGAGIDATGGTVNSAVAGSNGIQVSAGGNVPSPLGTAGTWSWTSTISYDPAQEVVMLAGSTVVSLSGSLSGDMNIGRDDSNYLYDYPLNGGGFGPTGDMKSVAITYGPDSPVPENQWTPLPGWEGTSPQDASDDVNTTVWGQINKSDPNQAAIAKPTVQRQITSADPTTKLIVACNWDSTDVGYQYDNVGVEQIVLPQNTSDTNFTFQNVETWTLPDTSNPTITAASQVATTNEPLLTGTASPSSPGEGPCRVIVVVAGGNTQQTLTATVNGTSWSAAVPTALSDGTYNVQATATDEAGNTAFATGTLTVTSTPVVAGISVSQGPAAGGTPVTITGQGFTAATAVDFGPTAATNVVVDSDTQITATSPAGTGTVDVTVTTPGGTSAKSAADQFTYVAMTWNGLGDGNWTDPTQWSGGPPAFPDSTADVTLNTACTITVDSAQSANSLDVCNSGDVTIAAGGSLVVPSGVTLGSGGTLSVVGGGTLTTAGLDETDASAGVHLDGGTLQAGAPLTTSVPLTIDAGGATIDTAGFDVTLAANLIGGTGTGGLTKTGSGSLIITEAGNYLGDTSVSQGPLIAENSAAIPAGSALSVGPDGSLVLGNPALSEASMTLGTGAPLDSALAAAAAPSNAAAELPQSPAQAGSQAGAPATTSVLRGTPAGRLTTAVRGQLLNFTAMAGGVGPGWGLPGGSTIFMDGGTPLGPAAALDSSGAAALGIATPSAGTHAITAGYGASVGNFTGGSGSVEEVVRPATAGTDRMASVAVRPAGAGLTRGGLRAAMHRSVASGPASVNDLALMSLLDESSG
jgi:autotransporter-associated beta strand protein